VQNKTSNQKKFLQKFKNNVTFAPSHKLAWAKFPFIHGAYD
jgi:hypothetical protein